MINKKVIFLFAYIVFFAVVIAQSDRAAAAANNLALGKEVFASGNEVDWLTPDNAVDGLEHTRWSSATVDDMWFYVDLGETKQVSRVIINWQTPAETYKILISNDGVNWVNVIENDGLLTAASKGKDIIEFQQSEARYVKFQGITRRPVEGVFYGYSFFEFEVYEERDVLPEIIEQLKANITVAKGQSQIVLPQIREGYRAVLYGSDRLPVVDKQGNINTPLVDVKVNLLLQVESETDPDYKMMDNVLVAVPGEFTQTEHLNAEPRVIPSLREWLGGAGDFMLSESSAISVNPDHKAALERTAEIWQLELAELTGLAFDIHYGAPKAGDLYLSIDDSLSSLGDEGYVLDINDYASIKSINANGVFFGTRSVLQLLAQDEERAHLPKGMARDYPKYEERGFMIDVARKFYTIDFLRDYVKQMSYYKMNRFQIHLNDDVGSPFPDGTSAAFRLESERYPGLASKSGFYTKEEFRELQLLGLEYGVNVVPEMDTPGHSGVFIAYNPSLGTGKQLDIAKPETVEFVKNLLDEYMEGDNPTFIGPDLHIGTDEYFGSDTEVFRAYMDTLIQHVNNKGKHPRLWGGLTMYKGSTPVSNEATMDIWYEPYGSAQQAIDLGYDIVNVYTNLLYIVPQLYRNYLNFDYLYNDWEPNNWVETILPYGHPNVKGGMFALWNDVSVQKGVSMADSHQRVLPAMQVLAEKMWTGTREDKDFNKFREATASIGDPPTVRLSHRVETRNEDGQAVKYTFEGGFNDQSGNGYDGAASQAELTDGLFGKGLKLNGGASYVTTPIRSFGFGWTVSMWVNPDESNLENAVLLESPEGQLILNVGNTGKIGFSKEDYTSVFNYKVPSGKWTHIVLTGDSSGTSLFVNGSKYVESLKEGTKLETFVLPFERIGSETNAFKGVIDDVTVWNRAIDLHGNMALNQLAESSKPESASYTADKAVDGKGETRWASDWVDDVWFMVDLGESADINRIAISWQTAYAKKYKIWVSNDKTNWTNIFKHNFGIINGNGGREVINFNSVNARYVKFEGVERATIFGYSFLEFEVFSDKNAIGDQTDLMERRLTVMNENLKEEDYAEDSWDKLAQALQLAELTLGRLEAKQWEVDEAIAALITARDGLDVDVAAASLELQNIDAIVANLNLPTKGLANTTIVWSSSNKEFMSDNGNLIKRPAMGQPDLSLTLTAAISKGEASANKAFAATIKAQTTSGGNPGNPGTNPGTDPGTNPGTPGSGTPPTSQPGDGGDSDTDSGVKEPKPPELHDIAGHWAERSIEQAVRIGFVKGYHDGTFEPDKQISRDEFITMLARALKLKGNGTDLSFKDVKEIPGWARPSIAQAIEAGIVTGYEDETFRPKAMLSRMEMAAMIVRGLGLPTDDVMPLPFEDADRIPQWARPIASAGYQAGLIFGRSGNTFAPHAGATRAEAAAIILRMLKLQ